MRKQTQQYILGTKNAGRMKVFSSLDYYCMHSRLSSSGSLRAKTHMSNEERSRDETRMYKRERYMQITHQGEKKEKDIE